MEGDERKLSGGADELEHQANGVEGKRRHRDAHKQSKGNEWRRSEWGGECWREYGSTGHRRGQQHCGGSRNRGCGMDRGSWEPSYDSLAGTDRKKKRIQQKEAQDCTIFVGDLDLDMTAEQLAGLFKKFGSVLCSKIKENHCYGFVTFDEREAAEAAIAGSQNRDGIELLNGKQIYVSWALGSLPEWKKGIGGFTVSPGKDSLQGHRSRKGVVKPSVLAAATAAAAAKAKAVLESVERSASIEPLNYRGRDIVAYDDLL